MYQLFGHIISRIIACIDNDVTKISYSIALVIITLVGFSLVIIMIVIGFISLIEHFVIIVIIIPFLLTVVIASRCV